MPRDEHSQPLICRISPRNLLLTVSLCALFIAAVPCVARADEPEMIAARVCLKDSCVEAEIADTDERREAGLMFRDSLPEHKAMLFVFPEDGMQHFWMKNMRFPIDIIWIDAEKKVVFIAEELPPCSPDSCPAYSPPQPARYVLEVAAGFSQRHRLAPGDTLAFDQ